MRGRMGKKREGDTARCRNGEGRGGKGERPLRGPSGGEGVEGGEGGKRGKGGKGREKGWGMGEPGEGEAGALSGSIAAQLQIGER